MTGHITVDYQVGNLPEGMYEGAPFQVDLSYDTATPESNYPEEAHYPDDPQRGLYTTDDVRSNFLRFRAGPSELSANELWLWVGNDIDGWPNEENQRSSWEMPDDAFLMLTTPFTSNFEFSDANYIVFRWWDQSRQAINSDSLPEQLNLSDFEETWFEIAMGSSRFESLSIRGIVTDISVVPEPRLALPALILLILFGCTLRRQLCN